MTIQMLVDPTPVIDLDVDNNLMTIEIDGRKVTSDLEDLVLNPSRIKVTLTCAYDWVEGIEVTNLEGEILLSVYSGNFNAAINITNASVRRKLVRLHSYGLINYNISRETVHLRKMGRILGEMVFGTKETVHVS